MNESNTSLMSVVVPSSALSGVDYVEVGAVTGMFNDQGSESGKSGRLVLEDWVVKNPDRKIISTSPNYSVIMGRYAGYYYNTTKLLGFWIVWESRKSITHPEKT